MSKRVVFTSSLLLAFVAGALGNVLAAAFCPRAGSGRACCLRHNSHSAQSRENHRNHHIDMGQMADMPMEMPAEPIKETSPQKQSGPLVENRVTAATALDQACETCSNCLNHSQLPLGSVNCARLNQQ